ncbi:MAG: rod shape-determining protein MreD [Bacteroidaceae bacterium]|nr:rod shape-determining protein MreD [Bacteroidaceae bacterium]
MIINYIQRALWFVGLVLLQVLILNHVLIAGYATPLLYVYFILKLDSGISRYSLLMLAFLLGIVIDIFSNTPGLNATAAVFLAFLRPSILRLFTPRDILGDFVPSFRSMGIWPFLKFAIASVLVLTTILIVMEFFSFVNPLSILIRIASCSLLTLFCIVGVESLRRA